MYFVLFMHWIYYFPFTIQPDPTYTSPAKFHKKKAHFGGHYEDDLVPTGKKILYIAIKDK